jgi:hypothetical protein
MYIYKGCAIRERGLSHRSGESQYSTPHLVTETKLLSSPQAIFNPPHPLCIKLATALAILPAPGSRIPVVFAVPESSDNPNVEVLAASSKHDGNPQVRIVDPQCRNCRRSGTIPAWKVDSRCNGTPGSNWHSPNPGLPRSRRERIEERHVCGLFDGLEKPAGFIVYAGYGCKGRTQSDSD